MLFYLILGGPIVYRDKNPNPVLSSKYSCAQVACY